MERTPNTPPSLWILDVKKPTFSWAFTERSIALYQDIEVIGFLSFLEDDSPFWTKFNTWVWEYGAQLGFIQSLKQFSLFQTVRWDHLPSDFRFQISNFKSLKTAIRNLPSEIGELFGCAFIRASLDSNTPWGPPFPCRQSSARGRWPSSNILASPDIDSISSVPLNWNDKNLLRSGLNIRKRK